MSDFATPLGDESDARRVRRFALATLASAIAVTAVTAAVLGLLAPVDKWEAALGLGAMIGFWMSPLLGVVIGNGYHEIAESRAKLLAEEPAPTVPRTTSGAIALPAAT
ncbi:MAG: hypothetical protein AAF548_20790 [Actinomycetota bacterium]